MSQVASLQNFKINPWFLTGFIDGEGCFWVSLSKDNTRKTGLRVKLYFEIHLHKRDIALLEQIKKFFGAGNIYTKKDNSITYLVTSVKELQEIRKHFEKYPLLTKKRADFELWAQILYLIQNKEHLTVEGLTKIVAIRASLNKGIIENSELKAALPHVVPVQRPNVDNIVIQDPNWVAGFTSAEGSFMLKMVKKSDHRLGIKVVFLLFELSQHARDEQLMKSLIEYFDCGIVVKNKEAFLYRVQKFEDIYDKIIPFFSLNRIQGVKFFDYSDWCKAAELINKKAHLTEEGLYQLHKIKAGMNLGRGVS